MIFKGLKTVTFILSFALLCGMAHAQYFETGQEPASVNWKQINTAHFQIIYPDEYHQSAQRIANILDTVYYMNSQSLKAKPKKISLVLHVNTSNSNAYVAWAPKRMEFFTAPPQNAYPQRWLQQLALHEYRHVVQITKINQGLTKALSYILGQQGTAGVLGLYIPLWFLEGDAICSETALSHAGRGRVPDFNMPIRAQILEQGIYFYDKAVFGSYRDYVPNHYILGYQLVAYGRKKYGPDIWDHTLNKVGRRPYSVVPFNNGIKDISGKTKTGFYRECLEFLRETWQNQKENSNYNQAEKLKTPPKKFYTNYNLPSLIDDNTLITIRSGIDDISRIISIDRHGNEKILHTPGAIIPDALSYSDSMLAWVEFKSHPRWAAKSYSNIKILNLRSGKVRQLTKQKNLFAPAFSSDGKKIAAVQTSSNGKYSLLILDSESGKKLKEITTAENYFFEIPSWTYDDNRIICNALGDFGKKIILIDVGSGRIEALTQDTWEEISVPLILNDTVYFTGSRSGISDVYAFDIHKKEIFRVFRSEYGIIDLNFTHDGKKLLFSEYSSDGYRPVSYPLKELEYQPAEDVENHGPRLYESLTRQENSILDESSIPDKDYQSENYSRFRNLFRFHSWAPLYIDIDHESFSPGLTLMSQNTLSTAFTSLGYDYDLNEENGRYFINFSYRGWFPVIDIEADFRTRSTIDTAGNKKWHETNLTPSLSLPLNLTNGKYYQGLTPKIGLTQKFINNDKTGDVKINDLSINIANFQLFYYHQLRRSHRDIYPRWGQILELNYRQSVFKKGIHDHILAAEAYLYFPGIIRHQGLRIYAGSQWSRGDHYTFGNITSVSRGISYVFADDLYSAKLDYIMPLLSPDLSISSLIYIKRFTLGLFYDYTHARSDRLWGHYVSTGIELKSEMHVLRLIAPFNIGIRGIYLPEFNELKAELIFGINFSSLY